MERSGQLYVLAVFLPGKEPPTVEQEATNKNLTSH
jgi:hypothetical protein